ncbi:hypothetical protein Hanom_Chr05g00403981 [Helianthus anomalus]
MRGKLQGDMADAIEAACNDPLPAYVDLTKYVAKDRVDALRLMLEPVEESKKECMSRRSYKQRLSDIFHRLDAANGLVRLQILVTEEMIRGAGVPSDVVPPRVSRSWRSIIYEDPSPADTSAASLSADTLMGVVPPDRVQLCHLGVLALPVVEENIDDLIVDPHPLEYYGEVLHTLAEVMATLSKK